MDLPQMKYFLAVCQARSFTRAAAICGISQPSLSIAIQRLEKELGGPLFDRGPPVQLLPRGEAIKPYFKAILSEVDKIYALQLEFRKTMRVSAMAKNDYSRRCDAFS